MAKLKRPFFSLASKGTIAKTITTQKRNRGTMARVRPVPTDPRTLYQLYHRWLYQDYCAWWNTLPTATKAYWRAEGAKKHMTGVPAFLGYQFKNMTDIAGWWKLDQYQAGVGRDSSKNLNHATPYGVTSLPSLIDGGLSFDGVNDILIIPNSTSLQITQALTLEAFALQIDGSDANHFITSQSLAAGGYILQWSGGAAGVYLNLAAGLGWKNVQHTSPLNDGLSHHYAATYDRAFIRLYVDGVQVGTPNAQTAPLVAITGDVNLGNRYDLLRGLEGRLDNCLIYNRCLTPSDILRHSLRRYPE